MRFKPIDGYMTKSEPRQAALNKLRKTEKRLWLLQDVLRINDREHIFLAPETVDDITHNIHMLDASMELFHEIAYPPNDPDPDWTLEDFLGERKDATLAA